MKITCDRCQAEIREEHIDLEKGTAKCTSCNNIFDCRSQLEKDIDHRRETIELPKSIRLTQEKERLTIVRHWLSAQLFYIAPLTLVWDAAFFIWYQNGMISTKTPLALAYVIFHILVALALTYYCVAGFVNRTIISVSSGMLHAIDTPLTFLRNIDIVVDELDQLYAKEKKHRGKKLTWSSYEVHAILKTNKTVRLVAGLNTVEQALFIEQVLEDYLRIKDRPVDGEVAR